MAGKYELLKVIGSGTFGRAWLAKSTLNQRHYVVKEIKVSGMSRKDRDQALTEVTVLARCRHVNVIRYREAYLMDTLLNIVMEYAEKGDLNRKIQEQKGRYFLEQVILDWFVQICFGLQYIHGKNIIHRDLKTHNIFLSGNDIIKIGDFGISRILEDKQDHANTAIGTPYYLSPEICQRQPYNFKSDMWAAGCVLYEMCTLKYAFQADNFTNLVFKIMEGKYQPLPSHYCPLLVDLVGVLLRLKSESRPSASQILVVPSVQPYVQQYIHKQNKTKEIRSNSASPHISRRNTSEEKENIICKDNTNKGKLRKYSVSTPKTDRALLQRNVSESSEPLRPKRQTQVGKMPKLNLHKYIIEKVQQKEISRQSSNFYPVILPPSLTESGESGENVDNSKAKSDKEQQTAVKTMVGLSVHTSQQLSNPAVDTANVSKPEDKCNSSTYTVIGTHLSSSSKEYTDHAISQMMALLVTTFPDQPSQVFEHMEIIREFLERQLGVSTLLGVYSSVQRSVRNHSDNNMVVNVKEETRIYLPLVYHLLVLENYASSCHA